jgi:hypothetical protein
MPLDRTKFMIIMQYNVCNCVQSCEGWHAKANIESNCAVEHDIVMCFHLEYEYNPRGTNEWITIRDLAA